MMAHSANVAPQSDTPMQVSATLSNFLAPFGLALRPQQSSDQAFLQTLFASVREEELASLGWPAAQKQAFLQSQYALQDHHYRTHYAGGLFCIVERNQIPVGRLYLYMMEKELRIVDISILTAFRNQGIGKALLSAAMAEAQSAGLLAGLNVHLHNRARRLYLRLGFKAVGAPTGIHQKMEWVPHA